MKKSLKKHPNNSQKLVDIDYLGGRRISGCLPMVYEDGFSRNKMSEWFYTSLLTRPYGKKNLVLVKSLKMAYIIYRSFGVGMVPLPEKKD